LQDNYEEIIRSYKSSLPQLSKGDQEKQWNLAILKIKEIFFNFVTGLVNNYLPFFGSANQSGSGERPFDFSGYLKIFPSEYRAFQQEFTGKTMVHTTFSFDFADIPWVYRRLS